MGADLCSHHVDNVVVHLNLYRVNENELTVDMVLGHTVVDISKILL